MGWIAVPLVILVVGLLLAPRARRRMERRMARGKRTETPLYVILATAGVIGVPVLIVVAITLGIYLS